MNAYPKYKDSGVEWLGEIPEHWQATLIKYYNKVTDGSHFSPKSIENGLPYVSVKDVGQNTIDLINCKKIYSDDFTNLKKNGCSPKTGDVILTKDGTIGRAAVITKQYNDFVILSSLGLLTPSKKVDSFFLYFYLTSGFNIDQMYSFIHGSALTRLTIDKICNLIFTIPPLDEQKAIATYLDQKTSQIDSLIEKKKKMIELLDENQIIPPVDIQINSPFLSQNIVH